jgi:hypothetical protein
MGSQVNHCNRQHRFALGANRRLRDDRRTLRLRDLNMHAIAAIAYDCMKRRDRAVLLVVMSESRFTMMVVVMPALALDVVIGASIIVTAAALVSPQVHSD